MAINKAEQMQQAPRKLAAVRPEKDYSFMRTSPPPGNRLEIPDSLGHVFLEAISTVIDSGDMFSVSRTSDGGALCICVMHNKNPNKAYAKNLDELKDLLQALSV